VAELNAAGQVTSRFVHAANGHVPSYMVRDGELYAYVRDRLGSVRLVVRESTGNVVQRIEYDDFGRVLLDTNPGFQPFGFVGGLTDPDTGLVHFGAREYDPESGRFLSRDPLGFEGGDLNPYAYVGNDPINRIDPLGTSWYDPSDWTLEDVSNFAANFGDTMTFGATDSVREALGVNDVVDPCSGAYTAGGVAAGLFSIGMAVATFVQEVNAVRGALTAESSFGRLSLGAGEAAIPKFTATMKSRAIVIAEGNRIDKVAILVEKFGGQAKHWKKMKTWDDAGREIHWYEHRGIGKVGMKWAGFHDPF
jgi:RHS repeat-associated protein